ncbi:hypothetical protein, partial [Neisseria lactamica]|uniref:hypothetical protein n=1 Tax=Neisseria lactamica TaxID=486 RepID=UPI001C3F7684
MYLNPIGKPFPLRRHFHCFRHSHESGNPETQAWQESIGKTETERMDSRLRGNDGSEVARNLKKPNGWIPAG